MGLLLPGLLRHRAGNTARAILILVLGVVACQQDRAFQTRASYEAPAGQYQVSIEAEGLVRAGADVAERASGMVEIRPVASRGGDHTIRLPVSLPLEGPAVLSGLSRDAGYDRSPPAEIEEAHRAIEGALLGPKGTFMDGQTRHLRVLSLVFERD